MPSKDATTFLFAILASQILPKSAHCRPQMIAPVGTTTQVATSFDSKDEFYSTDSGIRDMNTSTDGDTGALQATETSLVSQGHLRSSWTFEEETTETDETMEGWINAAMVSKDALVPYGSNISKKQVGRRAEEPKSQLGRSGDIFPSGRVSRLSFNERRNFPFRFSRKVNVWNSPSGTWLKSTVC